METKRWFESKTVWMNIVAFFVAFFPALQEFLATGSFTIEAFIAFAIVIANLVVRIWFTKTAIK